ncbi:MAG: hypothetical protein EXR79_16815 [Myxococcales bacterium]|nr:hypothetical protein [Myxococcales bacterium]
MAATLAAVGLIGIALVLARAIQAAVAGRLGWWAVPLLTGWIGVPVHEGAHLLAARLLGRRVASVRWFAPDPATGTLGRVQWEPGRGPGAWLAAAVVAIAPLAVGALVLGGLARLAGVGALDAAVDPLVGARAWPELDSAVRDAAVALAADLRRAWAGGAWSRAAVVAWGWMSVAIAAHMAPSHEDIKPAWRGVLLVAVAGAGAVWGLEAAHVPALRHVAAGSGWVAGHLLPGLLLGCLALGVAGLLALGVAVTCHVAAPRAQPRH